MFSAPDVAWNSGAASCWRGCERIRTGSLASAGVQLVGELLQRPQAGASIAVMLRSRRMTTGGRLVQIVLDGLQLVGGAEQERTVDAEDGDVVGNVLVLQDVQAAVFDVLAP